MAFEELRVDLKWKMTGLGMGFKGYALSVHAM